MAARPSWTGHLRVSLVTFPIQLFTGAKSTRNIPLRQIHEPSGKRVHNQPVVEGVGSIEKSDIVKGYEYNRDHYVVLNPDELAKIRLPTKKTIDITEFVKIEEIDPIYYDKPYYVVPQGDVALEGFSVFQQALKKSGKVAIGEVVLSGKEHLVAIKPYGKGMLLETLRYSDEVRSAHAYFEDLKSPDIDKDQLELALTLIKQKSSAFDPKDYDDSYETALHDLIDRKLKKLPLDDETIDSGDDKIINLMDALKRSVGQKTQKDHKKPVAKKPVAKKQASKKTVKRA